jgi:hypothetical protein
VPTDDVVIKASVSESFFKYAGKFAWNLVGSIIQFPVYVVCLRPERTFPDLPEQKSLSFGTGTGESSRVWRMKSPPLRNLNSSSLI